MPPGFDAKVFVKVLHGRINAYFNDSGKSPKADNYMVSKIITALVWYVASYAAIYLSGGSTALFMLLYLLHGISQIFFSFNVGHDALHYAVSRSRKMNRVWASSYDLLGVNTYMWRFMHHQGHHACLNVTGKDMSLETNGLFRFTWDQPHRPFHRYQHYYSFVVYGVYVLYYVLVKDFKYFLSRRNVHLGRRRHPLKEWVRLLAGKLGYLTYMIVVPALVLPVGLPAVLLAFFCTLFVMGLVMSFTFQTTHVIDGTDFPASTDKHENYVLHVFATTADYAVRNPVANWFFGGLNIHVIHHLRSDICHTHYPALTRIVRETAAEFGVPYREHTLASAFLAHMRQLKALGRPAPVKRANTLTTGLPA